MTGTSLSLGKVFDSFSRLSLDGIWVVDTEGRIKEVNEAYCKLIGYSREELLTMSIKDVEALETPPEIQQTIAKIKAAGVARFERAHRRKDGVIVPVEINATFIEQDQQQFFLAFIRDLTILKIVQKESNFNTALLEVISPKNFPPGIFGCGRGAYSGLVRLSVGGFRAGASPGRDHQIYLLGRIGNHFYRVRRRGRDATRAMSLFPPLTRETQSPRRALS